MASLTSAPFHQGQRLSYTSALCTVRYFGPLIDTKGSWLGVEWDDTSRGKHDGRHQGKKIFQCMSKSSTAASFIRPTRQSDPHRTVLEALIYKYGTAGTDSNSIEISGKTVEEVGFDKVQKQISVFGDLRIVLLNDLSVAGLTSSHANLEEISGVQAQLSKTCPNIIELDLGWNPIETWNTIAEICVSLKKLRILKTNGLRLRSFTVDDVLVSASPFRHIEELHLNECLLRPGQLMEILSSSPEVQFPLLKLLSLSQNELDSFTTNAKSPITSVTTLILDNNLFVSLDVCSNIITTFPNLTNLSLQGNQISSIAAQESQSESKPRTFENIEVLNLAGNQINDFSFIDSLPVLFPNLTSLRTSKNPLFSKSTESTSQTATTETTFFLTLARIPQLRSLNYTTISTRDREEGEIYYLSIAEKEIRSALESTKTNSPDIDKATSVLLNKYPRYESLCSKYDRESIFQQIRNQDQSTLPSSKEALAYPPGTLGARLINATFYLRPNSQKHSTSTQSSLERSIPNSITVYRLKSLIARHFSLPPLQFRLVYESPELEIIREVPVSKHGDESSWDRWGDWNVDEDGDLVKDLSAQDAETKEIWVDGILSRDGCQWRKREVEIRDGVRPWSDYLEDGIKKVRIRIEPF